MACKPHILRIWSPPKRELAMLGLAYLARCFFKDAYRTASLIKAKNSPRSLCAKQGYGKFKAVLVASSAKFYVCLYFC